MAAAGAPSAAGASGSAAEDAAEGGAPGADGEAKPKRVRKKKPKFKAAQHVESAAFAVPQLATLAARGRRSRLLAALRSSG